MPLKYRTPTHLLVDTNELIIRESFTNSVLGLYFNRRVKHFLTVNWEQPSVREYVTKLSAIADDDTDFEDEVDAQTGANKQTAIDALVNYVHYAFASGKICSTLTDLRYLVWFDGLSKGVLQTPVYTHNVEQLKVWRGKDKSIHIWIA